MIGRIADKAVLFDSHPRNKVGMANKEGKAIRAVFHGVKTLATYLKQLYKTRTHPDLMYTLEYMILDESVPVEGSVRVQIDELAFRMQGVTNSAKIFKQSLSNRWMGLSSNLKANLSGGNNSGSTSDVSHSQNDRRARAVAPKPEHSNNHSNNQNGTHSINQTSDLIRFDSNDKDTSEHVQDHNKFQGVDTTTGAIQAIQYPKANAHMF
ncbi:hypothetical protein SARC_04879 [Sphaeroforma arctica JP610]|uniref:Uncharacterized protein n=1 Tax=Sphaeroforma arctica JP610 TaxID=667725 RepID=A0A0L0G184_9EUKA|nr:hypothetical protein SARC_04879 [Sphaeroforma arctica JP610]KNC82855.1 hypothetical protein SARC_04879 [Sphaeroforma arctica JP610]|eukprot:XP_014156757.1 hypothetical protein SARC_04879 [Sphaeroforma arctica JP610]